MILKGTKKELVEIEVSELEILEAVKSSKISFDKLLPILKQKFIIGLDANAEFIEGDEIKYWEEYYHGSPYKTSIRKLTEIESHIYENLLVLNKLVVTK